jgi:hypothetical protein
MIGPWERRFLLPGLLVVSAFVVLMSLAGR